MSASAEARVVIEDVLDDFGFRLRWEARDHLARVRAFRIVARGEDGRPLFTRDGADGPVTDMLDGIEGAESFLDCTIKWDGCSHLELHETHFCGPGCWQDLADLLRHLWVRAFELMGREPEEDWAEARLGRADINLEGQ
jgi:hypothetical protein